MQLVHLVIAFGTTACGTDVVVGRTVLEFGDVDAGRTNTSLLVEADDLDLGPEWELAPTPVTRSGGSGVPTYDEFSDEELQALAEADPAWRAADGQRYEALIVLDDGTSFGRRGPAASAVLPSLENNFGSSEPPSNDRAWPELDPDEVILCGAPSCDRRTRVSSVTTLTGFPERAIGALNTTTSPGETSCTGTKVGPRAILTASHCVLDLQGSFFNTPGEFHPGQTNSNHPNTGGTSLAHSGVFLRDWRTGHKFDYAVMWLDDRADSAALGWLGVEFFGNAASYHGKVARLLGYPLKTGQCWASPLVNKACDGWMYRDSATLAFTDVTTNDELLYDIDASGGQSGSSVFTNTGGVWNILAVHWGWTASNSGRNRGARFRTNMWNDVCQAIALVPSAYAQHPTCN